MENASLANSIDEFLVAIEQYFSAAMIFKLHESAVINGDRDFENATEVGEELLGLQNSETKARRTVGDAAQQLAEHLESSGCDATNVLKVAYYIDGGGGDMRHEPGLWAQTKAELQRLLLKSLPVEPATNGKPAATGGVSDLPDHAMMNHRDLADALKLEAEPLRKRLDRWRGKNGDGWQELTEATSKEPRYLYRVAAVRAVLRDAIGAK